MNKARVLVVVQGGVAEVYMRGLVDVAVVDLDDHDPADEGFIATFTEDFQELVDEAMLSDYVKLEKLVTEDVNVDEKALGNA